MPRVKWGQDIGKSKPEPAPEPVRRGPKSKAKINKRELAQIERLAGYGLNVEQIAHVIGDGRKDGLSRATFFRQKKASPEIGSAIGRGRSKADAKVAKVLYEMATEDRNFAACVWWEKTRAGRYAAVAPTPAVVLEQERLANVGQTILVLPAKDMAATQEQIYGGD